MRAPCRRGRRPRRPYPLLEDLRAERLGPGSKGESIKAGRFEVRDGRAQRGGGRLVEHEAGPPVLDRLSPAALGEDDRRPAAGEGLEGDDPRVLHSRHEDGPAPAVQLAQGLVVDPAEERGLGRGEGPQPCLLRPGSDDPHRPARAAVGVEDELEALVGGEGGDDEVVGAGAVVARGEEAGVHRRRDHDRVAAVVAADAFGDVRAVRGEAVDAGRGPHVPGTEARGDRPDRGGGRGGTRGRGRSSRRSGPTRSASACGSSRGAARPARGRTPFATQWELETTRSNPPRSNDSAAAGKSGR